MTLLEEVSLEVSLKLNQGKFQSLCLRLADNIEFPTPPPVPRLFGGPPCFPPRWS